MSVTTRKILRSGASGVVALPPSWLRGRGLHVGDSVEVISGSTVVLIKPQHNELDRDLLIRELESIKIKGGEQ